MISRFCSFMLLVAAFAATGAYAQGTPAIIVAGDEAVLSAQMAGRIQKISVGLGTTFEAGAVLLVRAKRILQNSAFRDWARPVNLK